MNADEIIPIIVEKEGVSDTTYTIVDLYFTSGDFVQKGDLILCFETSKTAIDIEAPIDGYIFYNCNVSKSITIGDTVAAISKDDNLPKDYFKPNEDSKLTSSFQSNSVLKASKAALELLEANNIEIEVFDGVELLTAKEVRDYLAKHNKQNTELQFSENDVVIFGGGGHAKMCIESIRQSSKYNIVGIIDNAIQEGHRVLEIPVIGTEHHLSQFHKQGLRNAILGVGAVLNHSSRKKIYDLLIDSQLKIPTIIHPKAMVEPSVKVGEGNQIMQGAIVGSDVQIGNNCIINSGCVISHDAVIGNNVHIAPGALIAGGVTIKDNTVIGMGVTIFIGLNVGSNVTIHNGVHVFNDVEDNAVLKNN